MRCSLLAVSLAALTACGGPCAPWTAQCGMTMGVDNEVSRRTVLFTGIGVLAGGVAASGLGGGNLWLSSEWKKNAKGDPAVLDKADRADSVAVTALAIGIPLVAAGIALLFLAPPERPHEPPLPPAAPRVGALDESPEFRALQGQGAAR